MKITTIYTEAKLTKNFQSYTVGITAELEPEENKDEAITKLQQKCREKAKEQIELDQR